MAYLRGDETPEEIITLAYGMEEGLRTFYEALAGKTDDHGLKNVLGRLMGIEEVHKEKLFKAYLTFDPAVQEIEAFESGIPPGVMEGGMTTEVFLEKNRPALKTAADVCNMAMMLETQALDLYLRYAQITANEESKAILQGIGDEEKHHLKILGKLLETSAKQNV